MIPQLFVIVNVQPPRRRCSVSAALVFNLRGETVQFVTVRVFNGSGIFNGHRKFKERSSARGEIYMTKGRKTTQEERAEIVAFCIEHNKDYGLTVETYKVSYQQIYAWVRKYEEGGVDKLRDNRDRTKPVEEMTEVEKLKAEMKILEAKNRQLEIENAFKKITGAGRWWSLTGVETAENFV